jgi:hypothetical protein
VIKNFHFELEHDRDGRMYKEPLFPYTQLQYHAVTEIESTDDRASGIESTDDCASGIESTDGIVKISTMC